MPYAALHAKFPEIAERETRTITIMPNAKAAVPPANYQFDELFCDEADCDCRRVMFMVFSSATGQPAAVIAWGWESLDFYKRWMGDGDPKWAQEMKGPILNLASPQSSIAPALLRLAEQHLLGDPDYVERVKRHYAMFRERIDRKLSRKVLKRQRK